MKKVLILLMAFSFAGVMFAQDAAPSATPDAAAPTPTATPDPVAVLQADVAALKAADAATAKKIPALGGSVKLTLGSDNLAKNPFTFTGASSGSVGNLAVGIDNDQVSAGITVNTTPTITYKGATSKITTTDANINERSLLLNATDWYKGKKTNSSWDNGADTIKWRNLDAVLNVLSTNQANPLAVNSTLKLSDVITVSGTTGTYSNVAMPSTYTNGTWSITVQDPGKQNADWNTTASAIFAAIDAAINADIRSMADNQYYYTTATTVLMTPANLAAITYQTTIGNTDTGTNAVGGTLTQETAIGDNGSTGPYSFVLNNGALSNFEVTSALASHIKNAVNAINSYKNSTIGADPGDPSVTASWKITNAFFTLKKIFGVLDIGMMVNTAKVGVGSLVTSKYTSADNGDSNAGLKLALNSSVVKGLSASVLLNMTTGANIADPSTWYDYSSTASGAATVGGVAQTYNTAPLAGLQINAGYAMDVFGVDAAFAIGDLGGRDMKAANSVMLSITPSLTLKDVAGLNVKAEFDLARANGTNTGIGLGLDVGASIMGISPSVGFRMQTLGFSDQPTNLDGSANVTRTSLGAEFGSTAATATVTPMSLTAKVAVDLAKIINVKLVTINGGLDLMLAGLKNGAGNMDMGWSAGVALDFTDLLKLPLTLGYTISQYDSYDNYMTNDITLGYKYGDASIGLEFKNQGGKTNAAGAPASATDFTNSLYVTAGVSF